MVARTKLWQFVTMKVQVLRGGLFHLGLLCGHSQQLFILGLIQQATVLRARLLVTQIK